MEFEKNTAKFSFGAGTVKTAGAGRVSEAEPLPKDKSPDKLKLAGTAAAGITAAAAFLLKMRKKRK